MNLFPTFIFLTTLSSSIQTTGLALWIVIDVIHLPNRGWRRFCGQVKQHVIGFSAAGLVRTFTKPMCRANIQEENSKFTISQKSYLTTKCFSTEKFLTGLIFPWRTLWKGLHGFTSSLPHEIFPSHQRTEENMGQNRLGRLLSCVLTKEKNVAIIAGIRSLLFRLPCCLCRKFYFFNFYWCIVDLQCCVSFRYTAKWFRYVYHIYIYVYISECMYIYSFSDAFLFRLLQDIKYSFLCYIVSSYCLFVVYLFYII